METFIFSWDLKALLVDVKIMIREKIMAVPFGRNLHHQARELHHFVITHSMTLDQDS